MASSLGRIKAELEQKVPTRIDTKLISLLNKNINPPDQISADDIYVRAMYIVSDQINSYGGRFPSDELQHLARLIIDSPVMVGHRKDRLPIGRNFHAIVTDRDGQKWVKTYFYWLKSSEGSESLKENIDGGIYKECSVGFTFRLPECSVCGKDIRDCEHEPTLPDEITANENNNSLRPICFNYRRIERVLETSLVYRGAVADTTISKELLSVSEKPENKDRKPIRLSDFNQLPLNTKYLVMPNYNGLPVKVKIVDGSLKLENQNGQKIVEKITALFNNDNRIELTSSQGWLIGYRGKERLNRQAVEHFIEGKSSTVRRLELKLLPEDLNSFSYQSPENSYHKITMIRHAVTDRDNLQAVAVRLATTEGVRLWALSGRIDLSGGYIFQPSGKFQNSGLRYQIFREGRSGAFLKLTLGERIINYRMSQFNQHRLNQGGRFVADLTDEAARPQSTSLILAEGVIEQFSATDESLTLNTCGKICGELIVHSIKLNETCRFLIYLAKKEESQN